MTNGTGTRDEKWGCSSTSTTYEKGSFPNRKLLPMLFFASYAVLDSGDVYWRRIWGVHARRRNRVAYSISFQLVAPFTSIGFRVQSISVHSSPYLLPLSPISRINLFARNVLALRCAEIRIVRNFFTAAAAIVVTKYLVHITCKYDSSVSPCLVLSVQQQHIAAVGRGVTQSKVLLLCCTPSIFYLSDKF